MPISLGSPKRRGELAEGVFFARALALGYILSKPYGDTAPYDWVVGSASPVLHRVQVKAAFSRYRRKPYRVNCHGFSGRAYTKQEVDFIAAWIAPEDAWYIIPISAIGTRTEITLHPECPRKDRLFGRFREHWRLLGPVPFPNALATRIRNGLITDFRQC